MRLLRWFVLTWFMVSTYTVFAQTAGEQLRDLLTDTSCQKVCYLGIEPGITTRSEAETILRAEGITFTNIISFEGDVGQLFWYPDSSEHFMNPDYPSSLSYSGQTISQIALITNIPVDVVGEAFGSPDKVFYGFAESGFTLVYARLNLAFRTSDEGDRVTSLAIAPVNSPYQNQVNSAGTAEVTDICTTYGTPPCIAPAAAAH